MWHLIKSREGIYYDIHYVILVNVAVESAIYTLPDIDFYFQTLIMIISSSADLGDVFDVVVQEQVLSIC